VESIRTRKRSNPHQTQSIYYPRSDIFQAQKRGRDLNLEIIGFFHSHPDYPAIPSECDRVQAWEVYSYPIVSVIQGKAIEIKSWVLDEDRVFRSEEIQIVGGE
jgi:proteasome lid subunit RPN8/RPN11